MPPTRKYVIAFDADDTLWHNETIFEKSHSDFAALIAPYVDLSVGEIDEGLQAMVKRNIDSYGYGIKGFTLSMIEAALAMGGDRMAPAALRAILDLGHEMRKHPVDLIEGADEVVTALHERGVELWLITKGDLFDQESKIARSGLADKFAVIEIVSDKNEEAYRGRAAAPWRRSGIICDGRQFPSLGHIAGLPHRRKSGAHSLSHHLGA